MLHDKQIQHIQKEFVIFLLVTSKFVCSSQLLYQKYCLFREGYESLGISNCFSNYRVLNL